MKNHSSVLLVVVNPMLKLYQPPHHLKTLSGSELMNVATELYGNALTGFSQAALQEAWQSVISQHNGWGWPAVGEIVKVCREIIGKSNVVLSKSSAKKHPWESADEKWRKLAADYVHKFSRSSIAIQAKAEGWYFGINGLCNYVKEHASLQAKVISGCRNIGWNGWAWGYNSWGAEEDNYQENIKRDIDVARTAIEIHVNVSDDVIAWMRSRV